MTGGRECRESRIAILTNLASSTLLWRALPKPSAPAWSALARAAAAAAQAEKLNDALEREQDLSRKEQQRLAQEAREAQAANYAEQRALKKEIERERDALPQQAKQHGVAQRVVHAPVVPSQLRKEVAVLEANHADRRPSVRPSAAGRDVLMVRRLLRKIFVASDNLCRVIAADAQLTCAGRFNILWVKSG